MTIKTNLKSGANLLNHNQRGGKPAPVAPLAIRTNVKSGGMKQNHNQTPR